MGQADKHGDTATTWSVLQFSRFRVTNQWDGLAMGVILRAERQHGTKINTHNLVWVFLLCFWRNLRIEEVIHSDCFERILGHDTNLEDIALMVLYFPH
ncbi:Sterol 14-alpha demethylase [Frankliniella fusca]|uniref:Sterol 14-alpha demethylase n=1 Tax=Frankliniella fusca TaxID=407009 RepID=A0AAE1H951_9NEOP|nr:Sterol 14-alpha demethylase [Frankliniella fusca]